MSFFDIYDFELLKNDAEVLVIETLEKMLAEDIENKICKCQDCVLDMATYALNKVKPSYHSSLKGKIYSQRLVEGEYAEELKKIVREAIKKVSSNPSHDLPK